LVTETALPNSGTETRPNNIAFLPVLGTEEISTVPVGSFVWWTSDTVPDGYLLCDGSAVTATYATLRTILIDAGNPFGTDGSNPRLPDLVTDNRFIRGCWWFFSTWHNTKSSVRKIIVTLTQEFTAQSIGDSGSRNAAQVTTYLSGPANGGNPGNETRPNAIALLPILKY
jgi:hypothetical protein